MQQVCIRLVEAPSILLNHKGNSLARDEKMGQEDVTRFFPFYNRVAVSRTKTSEKKQKPENLQIQLEIQNRMSKYLLHVSRTIKPTWQKYTI